MTGAILTSDGYLDENSDMLSGYVEDNYNRFQKSVKESTINKS